MYQENIGIKGSYPLKSYKYNLNGFPILFLMVSFQLKNFLKNLALTFSQCEGQKIT